ncbi:MAG: amidohydrolase family protein [Acidobacteriia bacterium]|nr:amidohydrolase family protein [Terriglobia bacterium]
MRALTRRQVIFTALGPTLARAQGNAARKIDFHVHLGRDSASMRQVARDKLPDLVKYLTGEMDRNHVQKSMIVAVEPLFPTDLYLEAAKLAPERLLVACSVIPRPISRAVDQLKAYQKAGAQALKLQPAQYDPNDPAVERLVYEAVQLRMPVLFHHMDTPKTFPAMLGHFANTFADGNFVVIHFGGVYGFQDVLPLTRLNNVWLETSTAFARVVNSPMRSALDFLVDEKRLDRLIFGSELPNEYQTVCGAVDKLLGPNASPDLVKAVYRGNADRLLRISVSASVLSEEQKRDRNAKVADVFTAMGVKEGAQVAEVGAGDGFWVVRLAPKAGKVFAVDIRQPAVDRLRKRIEEDEIGNVTVIRGEQADPKLPKGALDAILIVNVYHEFKDPKQSLTRMAEALKPGGRLVVIDGIEKKDPTRPREELSENHEFTPNFVEADAREAGFEIVERRDPFYSEGVREHWMVVARRK